MKSESMERPAEEAPSSASLKMTWVLEIVLSAVGDFKH